MRSLGYNAFLHDVGCFGYLMGHQAKYFVWMGDLAHFLSLTTPVWLKKKKKISKPLLFFKPNFVVLQVVCVLLTRAKCIRA